MPAALSPRRSRRWIGFFVVLAVLAAVAIVTNLVYNLSIQLRPQQLTEARRRWQENGPADYDLQYLGRTLHGRQEETSQYLAKVRGGRVVFIVDNGEVVHIDPSLAAIAGPGVLAVSSEDPAQYDVPALFDQIEAALRQDEAAGQRNFTTAQFDPTDGHPKSFRRSVRATKEGVEWFVKLTIPPARPPRRQGP